MDKRMIGMITVMLGVCMLIVIGFISFSNSAEVIPSAGTTSEIPLLNKDQVMDIYVMLSEADYSDILENPLKEEYKAANVTVNGETVENVGFRVKGNSSLNMVAGSDSDRYSFKIDFDRYFDGQNMEGLTKLNLNNSISDPSYMREYLSYSLLNEAGIPTPAYAYANVYVNGELVGLYLAVEGIEEPFLERYYGSNYGTLYKPEGTGSDLIYTDDKIESYSGIVPKTESQNGSDDALIAMLKALNEGNDLENYLDIEEVLKYFAVNTVLVNMDSYQGNFKHNYYLYEDNGIFSILPWDYNMSFGGFSMGQGSDGSSTSLAIDEPVSGTTLDQRPLIGRLLEVEEYKDLYHQYIKKFIEGPFALDKMSAEIERVANLIRPHVEQDPTKFYTMEQFEQGITEGPTQESSSNITKDITSKDSDIKAQLQGEPGQPGQIQNDLAAEDQSPSGRQKGDRGGGDMMQGGNTIGLVKFIRERIINVSKQLSGELPTVGDEAQSQTGNPTQAQREEMPEGQMPNAQRAMGGMGQVPPDGEMPDMGNWMPQRDGEMRNGPPDMGNRMSQRNGVLDTQNLTIIVGSVLLLLVVVILVLRKKTKYSR